PAAGEAVPPCQAVSRVLGERLPQSRMGAAAVPASTAPPAAAPRAPMAAACEPGERPREARTRAEAGRPQAVVLPVSPVAAAGPRPVPSAGQGGARRAGDPEVRRPASATKVHPACGAAAELRVRPAGFASGAEPRRWGPFAGREAGRG